MAKVFQVVAETLAGLGHRTAFGLLGSGNFKLAQHLVDQCGGRLVWVRNESAALSAADAYAQVTHGLGIATVHQGPGLTNTLTPLSAAVREHTPVLVLAGETARGKQVSQTMDLAALAGAVGAGSVLLRDAGTVAADVARAAQQARDERRPVIVGMPIDLQEEEALPPGAGTQASVPGTPPATPDVTAVADLVERSERPLILAGRGAVLADARAPLEALGELTGALYATSLVANGLFAGNPRSLGVCGGFSSKLAERAVKQADLVLVFGASLNQWTTMHGTLIADAEVVRVDDDPAAIGRGVVGDAAEVARALAQELERRGHRGEPWLDVSGYDAAGDFEPVEADGLLDPRSLTVALDAAMPAERTVVYDGGHFHWFPTPFLRVPDADGFVPAQGFQSIGLGLGVAIGAATARPDRPVLLLAGDGGTMMSLGELDSLAAQRLPVVVAIFNDGAYGAEVHHFGPMGLPTGLVEFGDRDFAAVARALGAEAATIRDTAGVAEAIGAWGADGPLVLDCKVNPGIAAERLAEAFKGGA